MKFIPTQNYLLVQKKELKVSSVIVKPDTAMDGFPYGEVLAIGPDVNKMSKYTGEQTKNKISVGDKVLFLVQNLIILDEQQEIGIVPAGSVFAHIEESEEEMEARHCLCVKGTTTHDPNPKCPVHGN